MRIYCPTCWRDYPDTEKYCATCGAPLWEFSSDDFVAKLIRALHHPQAVTVERAATLLGRIGDSRAAEPLLKLLRDGAAPEALAAAALSLAELHEMRAIPELARLLSDKTTWLWVRRAAVRSLAQLGGPTAETAIRHALLDPSPSVRSLAAEALEQLGHPRTHTEETNR
jgi:HEAT repeat protein